MFWKAKIFDFRTFFNVFSMSFFKRGSEGEKIDQDEPQDAECAEVGGMAGGLWQSQKRVQQEFRTVPHAQRPPSADAADSMCCAQTAAPEGKTEKPT